MLFEQRKRLKESNESLTGRKVGYFSEKSFNELHLQGIHFLLKEISTPLLLLIVTKLVKNYTQKLFSTMYYYIHISKNIEGS
jgi:hypothetical protein